MSKLWKMLAEKGKFTTLLGVIIIIAAVLKPLIEHNRGKVFEQNYMMQIIYFMIAGIILIILPSKIEISKSGLKIED